MARRSVAVSNRRAPSPLQHATTALIQPTHVDPTAVKRAAFGFTNFDNYRIRALLYAGKPDWTLLQTLTPT